MSEFLMVAIGAFAGAVAYGVSRQLRRRLRPPGRVVEQPNSFYNAQLVRNREDEARWKSIALDLVHEINREEVKRLLDKVDALGVDSLGSRERTFLDHLAELFGTRSDSHGVAPPFGPATT